MSRIFPIAIAALALAGCQKAARFPETVKTSTKDQKVAASPLSNWMTPKTTPKSPPIEFVSSDKAEWRDLPKFWNVVESKDDKPGKIKIKVPLGLPDPTPLIPAANPPTLAKWRLGKKIFFDRALVPHFPAVRCADCHIPEAGFAGSKGDAARDTLSLLNVAYNRDQFWDGRVRTLEETLMPTLDDAADVGDDASRRAQALKSHRFPGVADRLNRDPAYQAEFAEAFGAERVNQDAVAKALATYLRTILSGDSVYDKARAALPAGKDELPTAEQFKFALTDDASKQIADRALLKPSTSRDELAAKIALGQSVFHGKGGCAQCHTPGLFTNHEFYNTSIGDSRQPQVGQETGRFVAQPLGLKDFAMRGAYRTPTLRNLSATAPYMHDGSLTKLPVVIGKYLTLYDEPLLAPPLRDLLKGANRSLNRFDEDESRALLCFLLALDGQPVDPIMTPR